MTLWYDFYWGVLPYAMTVVASVAPLLRFRNGMAKTSSIMLVLVAVVLTPIILAYPANFSSSGNLEWYSGLVFSAKTVLFIAVGTGFFLAVIASIARTFREREWSVLGLVTAGVVLTGYSFVGYLGEQSYELGCAGSPPLAVCPAFLPGLNITGIATIGFLLLTEFGILSSPSSARNLRTPSIRT